MLGEGSHPGSVFGPGEVGNDLVRAKPAKNAKGVRQAPQASILIKSVMIEFQTGFAAGKSPLRSLRALRALRESKNIIYPNSPHLVTAQT
ncbi:hypothetical protein [Novosphingobium sp.]|uniref:hypothetical protein n=1 Tax=Novosphingobium sp. TaxID=1874826 RepID=UPI00286E2CB3|nr:hypothetical protein [Novosphingobium sp.]